MTATVPETSGVLADLEGEVLDRELALMLRRSDRAMGGELGFARRLTTVLLTDDQTRAVDAEIADRAATLTPAAFRRLVRRTVEAMQPAPAHRHALARTSAGAKLFPEPDGMATLNVLLPAVDGVAALQSLNNAADRMRTPDDPRTHGQRQVAALLDALFGTAADATGAGKLRARRRTQVQITIDWATLVGLRDHPAEIHGFGPVPAAAVRSVIDEPGTVLRRLVHDPVTGVLLDRGHNRYRPDDALRGLVAARDVTCRYPGCLHAATHCDVDHHDDFHGGGATSTANCTLVCRAHHNLKTHHRFRYVRPDPTTGETVWTTPLGFTYRQHPTTYAADGIDTGDTTRERAGPCGGSSERPTPRHVTPDNNVGDDPPF